MRRLAPLALLLPIAAGCGGGSKSTASSTPPLEAVKAAAEKTFAAGSESLALTATADASGQSVELSGHGAFDTKTARGTLALEINAAPISTTVDEILLGTAAYLKSPLLTGGFPGGKTWLKLDLSKVHVSGLDFQTLLTQDPGAELKQLEAIKSATKVGSDRIGTHYRVQAATGTIRGYDVWVGDDGYIHRVVVAQSSPKASVTVDLSKFGEKVTAAAPPAAQVYESKNGSIPGLGGLGS